MDQSDPYGNNPSESYGNTPQSSEVISVGNWLLTLVLLAIPLVNLGALLYWPFASAVHPSKRTFAQAGLIFAVISISFYLVTFLLTGTNVLLTP